MVSPWNTEFLWQHTLINVPFCSYQDILPPDFERVPDLLQRYAVALHANPQLWTCNDAIEQVLHRRSLKKHQIATYLSFVQNVARHLQLLNKETFVERRFFCLGRNTN